MTSRSLVPTWIDAPLQRFDFHWFDRVISVDVDLPLSCDMCERIQSLKHLEMFRLSGKLYEEWKTENDAAAGPQCVAQLEPHVTMNAE